MAPTRAGGLPCDCEAVDKAAFPLCRVSRILACARHAPDNFLRLREATACGDLAKWHSSRVLTRGRMRALDKHLDRPNLSLLDIGTQQRVSIQADQMILLARFLGHKGELCADGGQITSLGVLDEADSFEAYGCMPIADSRVRPR
jgi:hypothetical protein